ncbi:hypothetical protein [Magnetospirillum gryphiswaldense]|uniref:hypothetical protein n=1 Tax=Magnetospirillum gryphiswaldense TaxID=55518 RepID=UPI0013922C54|nr:hypothetical protein [Magnetospirillum gryphiswaldense]
MFDFNVEYAPSENAGWRCFLSALAAVWASLIRLDPNWQSSALAPMTTAPYDVASHIGGTKARKQDSHANQH